MKNFNNSDFIGMDAVDLLYHEPPMVLIDRVFEIYKDGVSCEVDICESSVFADENGVPAYVGIEYMAQTIGVFDGIIRKQSGCTPEIGFLLGTRRIEFFCERFNLGQTLKVTALRSWDGEKVVQFECKIEEIDSLKMLAKASLTVYSPSRTI
ncbi:MAG: 3-hydroxydecanoyl-ACP dehydratase [Deltaproteobacteria bacterium]|nr:3-hydroxydecanoyl-ACP dehydratase [Deltaproteobacteria bacterium]